jgi:micrococcal nuclease
MPLDSGESRSTVGRRTWFVLVLAALLLAALVVALLVLRKTSREEVIACANYDSHVWAQSLFESDPSRYATLDPDGNGLACEELPHGVAPAWWTNEVPRAAEPATLISVSDGDTIRVDAGGREETVRLILIDTPETRDPSNPPECYGAEATAFLEGLLPRGSALYLERDVSERDRFGRLLRYVWLERGGEVYLVNEATVRSGYAAQSTFPPDVKYEEQIQEAARFAREQGYGLWSACETDADGDTNELGGAETEPTPGEQPPLTPVVKQTPQQTEVVDPAGGGAGCDPSYPDLCIPPPPPDLDCDYVYDQGFSHITVLPPDPHTLDGNQDGVACEGG